MVNPVPYKMDPNKSGVMVYFEPMREEANKLDDARLGQLFRAILNYADPKCEAAPVFEDETLDHIWTFVRNSVIRDDKTYRKKSEKKQYAAFCRYAKERGYDPVPVSLDWWVELGKPSFTEWNRMQLNAGAMQCNATQCTALQRMPTTSASPTPIPPSPATADSVSVSPEAPREPSTFRSLSIALLDSLTQWIRHWEETTKKPFGNSARSALADELRDYTEDYGEDAVCRLIRTAISSGYKSIPWDRLERERANAKQNPDDELRSLLETYQAEEAGV